MADLQLPYAFRDLRRPARYKAYYGGRGGGKSSSFAQELIVRGTQRPLRILCCREIQTSLTASVKQLLDDKIQQAGLGGFYHSTQSGIRSPNGTRFLFAGLKSDPETVRSMEGLDIAWIEEANTVSQRSLDLLIPTIRKEDSEIWFSWNRRHETDPVDHMFLGGEPPPRSIIRKVDWRDNPWFPDVLRVEMEWDRGRDHDKWQHIWEGYPIIHSEARVFKNWRVEELELPDDAVPRLGADWGFAVDPTVLVECYLLDARTLYFRREVFKIGCEIDETPALFAGTDTNDPARWNNTHGHKGFDSVRRGNKIVSDSARPETISYMKRRGFNIISAKKGARSVEEGVEFMRACDIVVHPDCVRVADELAHYSYKQDPLTNEVLPVLDDKHNHTIDACRYSLESVRRRRRHGRISAPRVITG